jgi:YD repeat-containing protein
VIRGRRNVTMAALAVVGLASIEVAGAASTTYSYDALGRLVRVDATGAQTSMRQSYQYDAAGNRVAARRSTSGPTGIIPVGTSLNSVGGSVTLSVSVGGSMAGGMIDFYFNDVLVGTAPVINGSAEIVFQGMALGNYTVRAVYAGDGHYDPATSQFNVRVQNLSWLPAVLDLLLE